MSVFIHFHSLLLPSRQRSRKYINLLRLETNRWHAEQEKQNKQTTGQFDLSKWHRAKRQVQEFSQQHYYNKKLETIQMPISNRMDKWWYIYTMKH